jgi:hypothetical protein
MKTRGISAAFVALVLFASLFHAGTAAAQAQKPRFEEAIVVTATPRAGSPSEFVMTFSGPVQVPGITLPAGTYLFRFPSETSKVIQVLKADRSNTYAMFHSIPVVDVKRDVTTDAHEITWRERALGVPPAIRGWFVPGRSIGYEFVYPSKG